MKSEPNMVRCDPKLLKVSGEIDTQNRMERLVVRFPIVEYSSTRRKNYLGGHVPLVFQNDLLRKEKKRTNQRKEEEEEKTEITGTPLEARLLIGMLTRMMTILSNIFLMRFFGGACMLKRWSMQVCLWVPC